VRLSLRVGAFVISGFAMLEVDLGKNSSDLHSKDKTDREIFRKKLTRQQMMQFFSNLQVSTVMPEHISLLSS
jgi:hypothetical protein